MLSASKQTLGEFLPRNDKVSTTRVDTTGGTCATFDDPFKLPGRLAAIEAAQLLPCLRRKNIELGFVPLPSNTSGAVPISERGGKDGSAALPISAVFSRLPLREFTVAAAPLPSSLSNLVKALQITNLSVALEQIFWNTFCRRRCGRTGDNKNINWIKDFNSADPKGSVGNDSLRTRWPWASTLDRYITGSLSLFTFNFP
mmetsp:Transcript_23853/g.35240  ORF Transcript_23853/g.35240 Transcript_23853/m.35240 type:complete len:200 (+) Transcript_23853:2562-3161(+)